MGARQKLNSGYVNGGLAIAGLIALVTGSGTAFLVALLGLLVSGLLSGDIRPWRRR